MFDVGFSELVVIAIVALVVIGPERLPKVARTLGLLLGRVQRYVNDVKADIGREMQIDELRRLQAEMQDSARRIEHELSCELRAIESVTRGDMPTVAVDSGAEAGPTPAELPPAARDSAPPQATESGAAGSSAASTWR